MTSLIDPICEPCIFGKQHHHNIPRGPSTPHSQTIARIHSDLKGPLITSADGGVHYWDTYICDKLQYLTVDFLQAKSQMFKSFGRFKAYVESFNVSRSRSSTATQVASSWMEAFATFARTRGSNANIQKPMSRIKMESQSALITQLNQGASVGCLSVHPGAPGTHTRVSSVWQW